MCLTKLMTFCNQRTSLVDKGEAVNIACFDLRKVFNAVSHQILIGKLVQYEPSEQTAKWIEKKWLNDWSQRVENNDMKSSWKLVTCSVPQQWCKSNHLPSLPRRPTSLQATATYPNKYLPSTFIAEHKYVLGQFGSAVSRLCPFPASCPSPSYLLGVSRVGERESLDAVPARFSSSHNTGVCYPHCSSLKSKTQHHMASMKKINSITARLGTGI